MKRLFIGLMLVVCLAGMPILSFTQSQTVTSVKVTEKIVYDDDKSANNKEYFGWAKPNTATSESKWKIMRITYSGNDFTVEFADGNSLYDNEWDNRATTVSYK